VTQAKWSPGNPGRFTAWIGTVPRQNSSGGKQRLGRITKQGNDYLRTLLFQGARSAVLTAHRRDDRLSRWIVQLQARVGYYKTLVAVANKHARILGPCSRKAKNSIHRTCVLLRVR